MQKLRAKAAPMLVGAGRRVACRAPIRRWASSSSTETVDLACELHKPEKPVSDAKTSPILFLHGLFGAKKNNRTISKHLARDLGRYVYALDLRNHGDSPHAPRHDYSIMADDVAAFIQKHELQQPTLIGHSMGAKTAMTLALRSPEAIKDLVSVDNAPIDARLESDFARYTRGMREVDEADVTKLGDADKILQDYEESPIIRAFLLGNLKRPQGSKHHKFAIPLGILSKALDNLGDFPFKDPGEARFEKPALFVRGTQSKYVPDEVLPTIGQFFPRFEVVDIESGHWVISEKPEEFRQAVVHFLQPHED